MLHNILMEPVIPPEVCKVKHMCQFLQDMDCNLPLGFPELRSYMGSIIKRSSTPQSRRGRFSVLQWKVKWVMVSVSWTMGFRSFQIHNKPLDYTGGWNMNWWLQQRWIRWTHKDLIFRLLQTSLYPFWIRYVQSAHFWKGNENSLSVST